MTLTLARYTAYFYTLAFGILLGSQLPYLFSIKVDNIGLLWVASFLVIYLLLMAILEHFYVELLEHTTKSILHKIKGE